MARPGIFDGLHFAHLRTGSRLATARVTVVPPPVRPAFAHAPPRATARSSLGIPADARCVLLMGGGWGLGPVQGAARALAAAGVHVLAVAGRNARLAARLESLAAISPLVHPYGLTPRIAELMSASDLVVTLPGALTCGEARAVSRGLMLLDAMPAMAGKTCSMNWSSAEPGRVLLVGYESGNQQILINIKKGVRVDRARQFTKDCRDLGITIHGTFIVGLPGESTETTQETIRFAKEINPHSLQVSIAAPYPGTAPYRQARENGWLPEDDAALIDERGVQAAAPVIPISTGPRSTIPSRVFTGSSISGPERSPKCPPRCCAAPA